MTVSDPDLIQDLAQLIAERTGYRLKGDQQDILRFIANRVQQLSLGSISEYLKLLSTQSLQEEEFSQVISSITNSYTYFFRDLTQLDAMEAMISRRPASRSAPLTIWCAGCATGEEPYSIAMICRRHGVTPFIYASDINLTVLDVARRARYHPWSLRHLPASYRERFFATRGDTCQLSPEITGLVHFKFHNLIEPALLPPSGRGEGWDWIICRNVMIYFDPPAISALLRRFTDTLRRDGYLFISSIESLHGQEPSLQPVQVHGAFAYQRAATAASERLGGASSGGGAAGDAPPFPAAAGLSGSGPPPSTAPTSSGESAGRPRHQAEEFSLFSTEDQLTPSSPLAREELTEFLSVDEGFDAAAELIRGGDREHGRELLRAIAQRDPAHILAHVSLGNLHLIAHDFERALASYKRAQDLAPLMPEVHFFLGILYRKIGDLTQAVKALREALFLQPELWPASFLLAGAYGRLGKSSHQRQNLQHTLAILRRPPRARLFSSIIEGMQDVQLDPEAIAAVCRDQLSRHQAPAAPALT